MMLKILFSNEIVAICASAIFVNALIGVSQIPEQIYGEGFQGIEAGTIKAFASVQSESPRASGI